MTCALRQVAIPHTTSIDAWMTTHTPITGQCLLVNDMLMRWISSQQLEYPGRNDDPDGLFIPADFHPDPIDWHQCIPPSPQPDIIGVYDGATAWNAGVNAAWNWNAILVNAGSVTVTSVPNQETTISANANADEAVVYVDPGIAYSKYYTYQCANANVGGGAGGSNSIESYTFNGTYAIRWTNTLAGIRNNNSFRFTAPDPWPFNGGAGGGDDFYKIFMILETYDVDLYANIYDYDTCTVVNSCRIGDFGGSVLTRSLHHGCSSNTFSGISVIKGFPALLSIAIP